MLRSFVNPAQSDWDEFLPAVEFAYNNSVQASTKYTPFFLNFGRHPHNPMSHVAQAFTHGHCPAALDALQRMCVAISLAKQHLAAAQQRQKYAYDQHTRPITFNPGDQVLLSTENLSLPDPSTPKLSPRFIGPFSIRTRVGALAYELALPPTMRCHNVFHVRLLRPYTPSTRPPPPLIWPSDSVPVARYEVERIVSHKPHTASSHAETRTYLIKWKHLPAWESTEEPANNIFNDVPGVVRLYWYARALCRHPASPPAT